MKHLITTIALLASTAASAQLYSGNELLERMNSSETAPRAIAMGYVAGAYDLGRGEHHCAPVGVTLGQLRDIAQRAIIASPATRHMDAAVLVTVAFMEIWPCPAKKGGNL
jgi:hypothetical protein